MKDNAANSIPLHFEKMYLHHLFFAFYEVKKSLHFNIFSSATSRCASDVGHHVGSQLDSHPDLEQYELKFNKPVNVTSYAGIK